MGVLISLISVLISCRVIEGEPVAFPLAVWRRALRRRSFLARDGVRQRCSLSVLGCKPDDGKHATGK